MNDLAIAVNCDFDQQIYREIFHLSVFAQGAHTVVGDVVIAPP